MARGNAKPQGVRGSNPPKAGNKRMLKEPPPKNMKKQDARDAGRQQFIAKEQLTVKEFQLKFDKNTQQFVHKLVDVNVPFLWDEDRKQFVYSPGKSEEEN